MINEIEIVEYKGFKNLKLDNLSQINVISGENNVGKTALLEALFIYEDMIFNHNIWKIFMFFRLPFFFIAKNRDITKDRINKYFKNIYFLAKTNKFEINIEYKTVYNLTDKEQNYIKKNFNFDYDDFIVGYINNKLGISPFPFDNNHKYVNSITKYNYINSSKPTNKQLVKLYSKIQSKGIQHKFITYLKLLDNDIEWIEPQLLDEEMLLRINLKNPERSLVSSELGEGTNRYIEILATLLSNSNGTVFIDEIENGIHYTKLYDIWKAIKKRKFNSS